jgi:hypothetical protein
MFAHKWFIYIGSRIVNENTPRKLYRYRYRGASTFLLLVNIVICMEFYRYGIFCYQVQLIILIIVIPYHHQWPRRTDFLKGSQGLQVYRYQYRRTQHWPQYGKLLVPSFKKKKRNNQDMLRIIGTPVPARKSRRSIKFWRLSSSVLVCFGLATHSMFGGHIGKHWLVEVILQHKY